MENKFIFADRHGLLCQSSTKSVQKPIVKPRARTLSNSESPSTKSPKGSGYDTDKFVDSSTEYLNLCLPSETKKTSVYSFQKKSVTIMEPNGHKVYPFKTMKKEKVNDGCKKMSECGVTLKNFLDISSSNLSVLSRSVGKLTHITQLYIYDNKISKLPKEIGQLVNLEELWMQENDIRSLPMDMKHCKQLKHLDVRHNHLGDDCLVVVKYFTNLEILLFNNNRLTRLDGIGRLKKLKTLSVKSNKLEGALTKSLGKLHCLVSLDLSKNKLVVIPQEIGQCIQLQRLNLEYNKLIELPDTLGNLQRLECIGIKYNRLERVPFSISECALLKELNIESNIISEIPNEVIQKLTHAIKINISHNKFLELPRGSAEQYSKTEKINAEYNKISQLSGMLSNARQLRVLNLCYNNLSEIASQDVSNLVSLVDLNISFNHLKEFPKEINQLSHLESLDVTSNDLTTLPREIGELKCLKYLNLESNHLMTLPDELGLLDKLKNLNISSNQLKIFPKCLVKLKNLEMLNVSENLFSEIPEAIGNLNQLTHLFLKDNKNLNDLPINIAVMKNLTFLSLSGCPLSEIPADYTKSPTTVIAYLRALEIGLRIHKYLQISNNDDSDTAMISSDMSLDHAEQKQPTTKSTESLNKDFSSTAKSVRSSSNSDDSIRPRSLSATASTKQQHLHNSQTKKSIHKKVAVPDYLVKKMKTTEAGFLACSKTGHKK